MDRGDGKMFTEIDSYIQNHDMKGIRYLFMDSLDVDPTLDRKSVV